MGTFSNPQQSGETGTKPSYTDVSGARSTSNVGSSAAIREVQEAMITYEPFQTPMLNKLMSSKFGKKPTGNQKFEWMESSLLPRIDTITLTGGAASEDTVTPGTIDLYQVGTKFIVDSTGDVCIADTKASTTINVTKVGSGNITAVTGATIHFLGDSFEQGTSSATAKSVNKNFVYNYCEIFKKSVNVTESQAATVEYGPQDYLRNKTDRMAEFKLDIEANLLWGVRSSATGYQSGANTQFFTGGFYDSTAAFVGSQYVYPVGAVSEDYFFKTFLRGAFAKGKNVKTMYAGSSLVNTISNFSAVKQKTQVQDDTYGYKITKITHDFGLLNVVWHPMLTGTYAGDAILLDDAPGRVMYRYLAGNGKNRDLNFFDYTNPLYQETDQEKGEWKGEIGWQIEGNEYHALLKQARS